MAARPAGASGMWDNALLDIVIDDVEEDEVIVVIGTPVGTVHLMGTLRINGRVLHVERAHIHGLTPGALGRAGVSCWKKPMSKKSSLREVLERQAQMKGGARKSFAFPTTELLLVRGQFHVRSMLFVCLWQTAFR
jgi:hypothetical protein